MARHRRLPQRGDGRVPPRRRGRSLLPRDEHPPPGRARRHGAGDRPRPGGVADLRIAAGERLRDGGDQRDAARPRDRGAALRRGPVRTTSGRWRGDGHDLAPAGGARRPRRHRAPRPRPRCRSTTTRCSRSSSSWRDDRPAAIARLRRALDETLIGGVQTDHGFLRWLVDEPGLRRGRLRHLADRRALGEWVRSLRSGMLPLRRRPRPWPQRRRRPQAEPRPRRSPGPVRLHLGTAGAPRGDRAMTDLELRIGDEVVAPATRSAAGVDRPRPGAGAPRRPVFAAAWSPWRVWAVTGP